MLSWIGGERGVCMDVELLSVEEEGALLLEAEAPALGLGGRFGLSALSSFL